MPPSLGFRNAVNQSSKVNLPLGIFEIGEVSILINVHTDFGESMTSTVLAELPLDVHVHPVASFTQQLESLDSE